MDKLIYLNKLEQRSASIRTQVALCTRRPSFDRAGDRLDLAVDIHGDFGRDFEIAVFERICLRMALHPVFDNLVASLDQQAGLWTE